MGHPLSDRGEGGASLLLAESAPAPILTILTRDTGRDIAPLLARSSAHPRLLLALVLAESSLNEHSERYRDGCDKSAGLVHQSVCYVTAAEAARIPGFDAVPDAFGRYSPTRENYEALRAWYWDAERALADAGPRLDALKTRWRFDLEALCRWNKPNLAGAINPNRPNYERALAEALRLAPDDWLPWAL